MSLHRVTILLSDEENQMVLDLESKGWRRQDIFRFKLRDLHRKEFPPYAKKQMDQELKDKLTDEQYCEQIMDGSVEGGYCVIRKDNGLEVKFELDKVKNFTKDDV